MRANAMSWARLLPRPVVATPAVMGVVTGGLYVSGGLLALVVTFMGGTQHRVAECSIAVAALVLGLAVGARPIRQGWSYHALNLLGSVLITIMIVLSGGGHVAEALAVLYVFVTLDAFFFFPWQIGLVYHLFAVCLMVATVVVFEVLSVPVAVAMVTTQTVAGWVVGWLVTAAGDAEIDAVTGLANRRGLDRAMARAVDTADHDDSPLAVALVDLDHFKAVNDRGGHSEGDRLLRAAAEAWSDLLPADAVLARHGGDEFVVLLPNTGRITAVQIVEQLRLALTDLGLSCSAGVAVHAPGQSSSSLVSSADTALYQAKRGGRGHTREYDGIGSDFELRAALAAGQFHVVYQPVVELRTKRVTGAEALLRWTHPTRGNIPPAEFIPLAEATGLICELDEFVLEQACATAAAWPGDTARIGVNVSGPELLQDGYVARVQRILAKSGLDARRLVLEVTETSIGADAEESMRTLRALRELGIRVAVDDFGVGYSSLSRLDRLPVDILKLDRSFVAAIPEDGADAPLIAAVAALAAAVGLDTVAEGIEHPYQARLLARYGFDRGQGYLFGRPQPADQLFRTPSLASVRPRTPVEPRPDLSPSVAAAGSPSS